MFHLSRFRWFRDISPRSWIRFAFLISFRCFVGDIWVFSLSTNHSPDASCGSFISVIAPEGQAIACNFLSPDLSTPVGWRRALFLYRRWLGERVLFVSFLCLVGFYPALFKVSVGSLLVGCIILQGPPSHIIVKNWNLPGFVLVDRPACSLQCKLQRKTPGIMVFINNLGADSIPSKGGLTGSLPQILLNQHVFPHTVFWVVVGICVLIPVVVLFVQ